jgi:hypothetical protein
MGVIVNDGVMGEDIRTTTRTTLSTLTATSSSSSSSSLTTISPHTLKFLYSSYFLPVQRQKQPMSTRSSALQVVDELDALIRHPPPSPVDVADGKEDNDNGDDEDCNDDNDDDDEEEDDDKDSLEIVSPLPNDPFLHIGKLLKFCEPSCNHHHQPQQPHHPFAATKAEFVEESRHAPCTRREILGGASSSEEGRRLNVRTGVEESISINYNNTMDWWAMRLEQVKEAAGCRMEEVKQATVIFLEHANDQFQKFGDKKQNVSTLPKVEKPSSRKKTAPGLTSKERRLSSGSECESDSGSSSCEEDDDSLVIITEECSRAARVYIALETTFVAVLLFAIAMHIVKRLGGVFAIETRRRDHVVIVHDDLEDDLVCGEQHEPRLFSFISFAPSNDKMPAAA